MSTSEGIELLVLKGDFDNLPPKVPSEIRIFLSSTFKDYQAERNYLIENVYDVIRKSCLEKYQKDLILIDMRFGITDEAANQQITTQICLNEIEKCQKESIGPSFVAFLSHRYGSRILQLNIEMHEFHLLKDELQGNNEVISLLEYCYDLDNNTIREKEYKLKRVDNILRGLNIDRKVWRQKEGLIIESIRKAADSCLKKGKLTKSQWCRYFTSVTDQEVQMGILEEESANLKTLVFFRDIHGLAEHENTDGFTETDIETKILLNELKIEVRKKLALPNKHYFEMDWLRVNKCKEPYTEEMASYLKHFGAAFKNSVSKLIDENMQAIKSTNVVDAEILHHARFCNILAKKFTSRPYLIDKVMSYLDGDSIRPFVIAGCSGAGKSCLMAHIAKEIKAKQQDTITIVRFMGTSRESSSMKSIMKSLISQLSVIFNEVNTTKEFESVIDLRDKLIKLLFKISSRGDQKIFMFLDSIDQLTKQDYTLDWIFYELPKNVKIVYSVIKDYESIYERLQVKLKQNCLEIEKLMMDEAVNILKTLLLASNRQLSSLQWETVNTLFTKTREIYPLHVKLLFDITSKWTSTYSPSDDFYNCVTIKNTVKYLFKKLEALYGQVLFSRCIFYLTLLEYKGISELELQDVLSIDDEVLTSVFQHHHPPVRKFPLALWMNIKFDLKEYITHKETDGVSVISWFHRSFIEASYEYYKTLFEPSETKDRLLGNIIDYFIEKWNAVKSDGQCGLMKEFVFQYRDKKLTNFPQSTGDSSTYLAYRNTKSQKLRFELGGKIEYNRRKLNELINVINMFSDVELKVQLLKQHVYFNYEFMLAKAELQSLSFVVDMHEQLLKLIDNDELLDISEIYVNNYPKIEQNLKESLTIEVLSRLNSRSEYVKKFAEPSNLLLLNSYIQNDAVRDLYLTEATSRINEIYSFHSLHFIFVETYTKKEPLTSLTLINSKTKHKIGRLNFTMKADCIRIYSDNSQSSFGDIKALNDLNGCAYYTAGNALYSIDFNNEESKLVQFEEEINEIFLLKANYLLVSFKRGVKLVQVIQDQAKIVDEILIGEAEIDFLISTTTKNCVYLSEFLNHIAHISVIIGYAKKSFKVYKFTEDKLSLVCEVTDEAWNADPDTYFCWPEIKDFVIDQDFLIENYNWQNEVYTYSPLIRCAIEKDGIVKIVEIRNNGEYMTIDKIDRMADVCEVDKSDFSVGWEMRVQIVSFYRNRVVTCLQVDSQRYNVYVYDLLRKTDLKMSKFVNFKIEYLVQSKYLIVKSFTRFVLFEISDSEIKKIMEIKADFKNYKKSITMKDDKLYLIETRELLVKELDTSIKKKEATKSKLKVLSVISVLDNTRVLAEMELQDLTKQVAVIDIVEQNILKSLTMHKRTRVVGFKMPYCLLSFYKEVREEIVDTSDQFVFLYRIEDDFEFTQILKKPIETYMEKSKADLFKCYFDDSNVNKIYYPIYNETKGQVEIRVIEVTSYDYTYELITLDVKKLFNFNGRMLRGRFTSIDKYFCLYDIDTDVIYIIDIHTKQTIDTIKVDFGLAKSVRFRIEYVPFTNDLLFKQLEDLFYMKFDAEKKQYERTLFKRYSDHAYDLFWMHGLLIINATADTIEIFKYADIVERTKTNGLILRENYIRDYFSVCRNQKYFALMTNLSSRQFVVYKLNKDDTTFKQISSMRLTDRIECISISEEYITARVWRFENENVSLEKVDDENRTLLTFKILNSN